MYQPICVYDLATFLQALAFQFASVEEGTPPLEAPPDQWESDPSHNLLMAA